MARTIFKCSANTAKAIVFTLNAIFVLIFTTGFRFVDPHSPWRMVMLIGVVGNCFIACILGTLFGSLDCRKTSVKLRASKDPIVFSIKLPIEEKISSSHLEFFKHQHTTINMPHPKPKSSLNPIEYNRAWLTANSNNNNNNSYCNHCCNNNNFNGNFMRVV